MPKYTLNITRFKEYENVKGSGRNANKPAESSTISKVALYDNDKPKEILFHCFCLENGGASTDTPKQDKRIIARKYNLEWTYSARNASLAKKYPEFYNKDKTRHKAIWLKTKELEFFASRRILIHIGNCPQDTEGCLLFGYEDNKKGQINNSTQAIYDFFKIVEKIGIENITLNINEIISEDKGNETNT